LNNIKAEVFGNNSNKSKWPDYAPGMPVIIRSRIFSLSICYKEI